VVNILNTHDETKADSIRAAYERHGAEEYYRRFGAEYRNPHEPMIWRALDAAIGKWQPDLSCVLDLAAGSGEVTLFLRERGAGRVDGIDPYTAEAYRQRTGQEPEALTFADIAAGALARRKYSLIVCSFALHLCEKSRLPRLMMQMRTISDTLLILTPHKRPEIRKEWGWQLTGEILLERVKVRYYKAL
jgi:SAM-dependent methyltransferase